VVGLALISKLDLVPEPLVVIQIGTLSMGWKDVMTDLMRDHKPLF
jgi:hypothetical protein